MNNYFKTHPMYIKSRKNIKKSQTIRYNSTYKYENELGKIFKYLNKDVKILEIWFGSGNFTYFCKENRYKNYTWIDIDNTFIEEHKKEFKDYNFFQEDIVNFLQKNKWYDVIFMAHVFEHLNKTEAKDTIKLIYSALNEWWYRINYMPNADSYLNASTLRYIDITHKTLYNSNSLEQIILSNEVYFSKIQHLNTIAAIWPLIRIVFKILHPIFLWTTKIYFYGMWFSFPKIYTSEILSIMKK